MNWKCLSVYQVVEGIKPTLLELQKFETAPEDVELEGNNCRSVAVCIGDGDKIKSTFPFCTCVSLQIIWFPQKVWCSVFMQRGMIEVNFQQKVRTYFTWSPMGHHNSDAKKFYIFLETARLENICRCQLTL